jgi:CdiA C-terminal tRNase domain
MTGPLVPALGNALVVPSIEQPSDMWSGIWIAEDIELIVQGVRSGSWIDTAIGGVAATLDGLAFVDDPAGVLMQYLASSLMEHVKPFRDVLNWLAGDPAQIAGSAQTWRNVSLALIDRSADFAAASNSDVPAWSGPAASAYRSWSQLQRSAVDGLANACEALATMTEYAGYVVGAVRILVRDLVAVLVSRLIDYGVELAVSGGYAAPLVLEQVTFTTLSCGAKVSRLLRALVSSLRTLFNAVPRLVRHIDELKRLLGRLDHGAPTELAGPAPVRDPLLEAERVRALGMDPKVGAFRPAEAQTAVRIEQELGVILKRASPGDAFDWVDDAGRSYDAIGNFPSKFFDKQWAMGHVQRQILRHVGKADFVPIDVSQFTPPQIAVIRTFIETNNLGPRVFVVGE